VTHRLARSGENGGPSGGYCTRPSDIPQQVALRWNGHPAADVLS
jgi:hypothetical protein